VPKAVAIVEDPGRTRVGRVGWKDEHAILLLSAGAHYVDEIGITTPINPVEETSNGNSIAAFDDSAPRRGSVLAAQLSVPDDNAAQRSIDVPSFALTSVGS
jgi:hypothetical protein